MTTFCPTYCGMCDRCVQAMAEVEQLDAVLETLSDEDRASLLAEDPDDPRTYALDHKGRP